MAMCLVEYEEDFPGGSLYRLQTLAFWLSWIRLHYTKGNALCVSHAVLAALGAKICIRNDVLCIKE